MGSQVSGPTFGDASSCINHQHQHLKSNATTPPTKCEHDELKTAQNMRGAQGGMRVQGAPAYFYFYLVY